MADQPQSNTPSPEELAKAFAEIAEHSQKVAADFMARTAAGKQVLPEDDIGVTNAFMDLAAKMWSNPMKLAEAQMRMWHDYMRLWHSSMSRLLGEKPEPVAQAAKSDSRFKNAVWENNFLFDYIKQSYLIAADNIQKTVAEVQGLDPQTTRKVKFFTRQFVDALAPTNFVFTNPEVLKATVDSGGRNLIDGLHHLLDDLERGGGQLAISMTDYSAFEVGKNVATAPGKVVYQTDLMQLIQFSPSTETVWRTPLLIIPPWINKYYILDLREKNSFIRWATAQGHTVFVISWVNPDERYAGKTFEDYMLEGPWAALNAIEQATGEREINIIGYCLGGTLLACFLAWLAMKGEKRIKSATFFTAMIDFTEPGELGVFVDEGVLANLEKKMAERGYLEGSEMADHLQPAACQRPDLVVRGEQLSAGQGPVPVRPAVLELGLHPHAGEDAHVLPAQHVHQEPAGAAGRDHAGRRADRSRQREGPGVLRIDDGRPHRAMEEHLPGREAAARAGEVHSRRLRSHRRHRQPARGQQVQLLDRRQARRHRRRVAGGRDPARRLLVAGVEQLGQPVRRREGARAHSGRRQAQGAGGCAGVLREAAAGREERSARRYRACSEGERAGAEDPGGERPGQRVSAGSARGSGGDETGGAGAAKPESERPRRPCSSAQEAAQQALRPDQKGPGRGRAHDKSGSSRDLSI